MDCEKILSGLIRVGTVTDVDNNRHMARVKFQGEGFTSGWLYVLDNRPAIPDYDKPQKTEEKSGGSGYAEFAKHDHDLVIKQWMPVVNSKVLVAYLPVFNADGFVLGGIG